MVVAKLAERSLPVQAVRSSNLVNFYDEHLYCLLSKGQKQRGRELIIVFKKTVTKYFVLMHASKLTIFDDLFFDLQMMLISRPITH